MDSLLVAGLSHLHFVLHLPPLLPIRAYWTHATEQSLDLQTKGSGPSKGKPYFTKGVRAQDKVFPKETFVMVKFQSLVVEKIEAQNVRARGNFGYTLIQPSAEGMRK